MRRSQFRWRRSPRRNGWLRAGLLVLAFGAGLAGVWALVAPRSFYEGFPGAGFSWVVLFPPYNEHLVRDVGALYVGFLVLFLWALVSLDRRLVRASSVAWLATGVPHLIFHLTHGEGVPGIDRLAQNVVLSVGILIPVALILLTRGPDRSSL